MKPKKSKLTRSKKDKMITGLLGGISEYYGIDSTIVRVSWLIIIAFTGFVPGIIVYAVAATSVPASK